MKKLLILLFLLLPVLGLAEDGPSLFLSGNDLTALQNIDDSSSILSLLSEEQPQEEPEPEKVNPIREKWIDEFIALSKTMYERTGGKAQRAHESGDIYRSDIEDIKRRQDRLWNMANDILERLSAIL